MAGLLLPLLLLVGAYVYYEKLGGKQQLDSILGNLKGGGGSDFSFRGGGASVDVNLPTVEGINGDVQSMLQKMGVDMNVNNGSGQSISRTRQIDTTGQAVQKQSHNQRSSTFFTIPRFGNL